MDAWGWDELQPWLELRADLPVGPLFCVLTGRTRGPQWSTAPAPGALGRTAPPPRLGLGCAVPPPPRVSVDDSLHISCAAPAPSSWLAKPCRSSSFSGSSAT